MLKWIRNEFDLMKQGVDVNEVRKAPKEIILLRKRAFTNLLRYGFINKYVTSKKF